MIGSKNEHYKTHLKNKSVELRVNNKIRVLRVRLISKDGERLGIVSTLNARKRAQAEGLDLVEVSASSHPPVCRIMDYGKFKYQQKRKSVLAKKKQVNIILKEIKFRPKTDKHDFDVKVNRLKRFLKNGNKVKITMMFRGREIVHTNIGKKMLLNISNELKNESIIESSARMDGRQMVMIVSPLK